MLLDPAMRSAPGQVVIDAAGLTKIFRDFWMRTRARAVDGVDFQVRAHEIFGLLGPNGSGKSTIIKMILGLLHKSRGRLTVFGREPPTSRSRSGSASCPRRATCTAS